MTEVSGHSIWKYLNDSMVQYGVSDSTSTQSVVAGVGLVLDTRLQDAQAEVRRLEKEVTLQQGGHDNAVGEVCAFLLNNVLRVMAQCMRRGGLFPVPRLRDTFICTRFPVAGADRGRGTAKP